MIPRSPNQAVVCPGGPMLLRGLSSFTDAEGLVHEIDRPLVAVCRCGFSRVLPWCDSTHKRLPEDKRPD
ncbi:MAG: CDGSH iron-sulfur domain-containing protein [Actinomycetota bacterium]|nr:CDGSH iron-sulfur domain-containing protein [Actinomycetota bacterium]